MQHETLARLFERFRRRGSTAALARVFDATAPALLRVARRLTGDLATAEDALQSTFLAAIERAAAFDATRPLEPWLVGILVRQVGLLKRRAARAVDPARLAPAEPADPAQMAEQAELAAAVDAALRELDESDRALLTPWLSGEARGSELARRAGVGGSTLRMRLHRGLARLRRALPAGFGAGIVVTAAEREALARSRSLVLAAIVRGTAATASATALGTTGAKLAAALLVAGAAIGGAALLRKSTPAAQEAAERSGSQRSLEAAATTAGRPAVLAVRAAEPAVSNPAGGSGSTEGPLIATSTTEIALTQGRAFEGFAVEVVGGDGAPVPGARLRFFDDDARAAGPCAEGSSGRDGTLRIVPAQATSFHVVVEKEGFGRAVAVASIRTAIRIKIEAGSTVAGTVTRDDGAPVAGATVELADGAARFVGARATTSGADGRYAFDHVAGPIRWIRARSADGVRFGFGVPPKVTDDRKLRCDVGLHEGAQLELTVLAKSDGRPVEGALVVVRAGPDATKFRDSQARGASRLQDLVPCGAVARSDAAGRVTIGGLPAGAALRVAVAADRFAPAWREVAPLRPGEARAEPLELDRPCRVDGFVRDCDGAPLAGAAVALDPIEGLEELRSFARDEFGGDPFGFATTSGADGRFELDGVPPLATHLLRFGYRHEVAFAELRLPNGGDVASGMELIVGQRVPIRGRVVAEDGPAPKGTQVFRAPASELAVLDADGIFEFTVNSRIDVTICAVAPGYVHAEEKLAAPLDLFGNRVFITLRRGASLRGRVVDRDRRPVAGARVIAWPGDPTPAERDHTGGWLTEVNLATATSSADGAFTLRGLPDRPLRLIVKSDGFEEASVETSAPSAAGSAGIDGSSDVVTVTLTKLR